VSQGVILWFNQGIQCLRVKPALNPESVILNHGLNLFHGLVQNLFWVGLFQAVRVIIKTKKPPNLWGLLRTIIMYGDRNSLD